MEKTKKRRSVKEYFTSFFKYCKGRCSGSAVNIVHAVLIALYFAFCVGSLIYFAILGGAHYRDCLIGLSYIVIVPIIFIAEFNMHIRSPLPYTIFVLVFCTFCFLGASYNFYTLIPRLDDILHACWGVLFSTLGFAIVKSLMGEPENLKQFVAYLVFSIGFCMLISILWEVYEFTFDSLFHNYDMQEDTLITHFHSFWLRGYVYGWENYDHLHTYEVDGIAKTILYDKDGNVLLEMDGYLDLGLYDTMWDIIWCFVSTCALTLILSVDRALGGKIYPHIIPVYEGKVGRESEKISQAQKTEDEKSESGENAIPAQEEDSGKESE